MASRWRTTSSAPILVEHATAEQRARWLPGITAGDLAVAIAMSEPGARSDLRGIASTAGREGGHDVVNGLEDVRHERYPGRPVIVVVRTGERGRLSLVVVEAGMEGFQRAAELEKIVGVRRKQPSCSSTKCVFR